MENFLTHVLKMFKYAYEAAQKAFIPWSETSIENRSAILLKIAHLIEANLRPICSSRKQRQRQAYFCRKDS